MTTATRPPQTTDQELFSGVKSTVDNVAGYSRESVLDKLSQLGINSKQLETLKTQDLVGLLANVYYITGLRKTKVRQARSNVARSQGISDSDKKILLRLLNSSGHVSSLILSRELGIPLSTIQRRRKRLESAFIDRHYTLKSEKFGWRSATLFVSVINKRAEQVGREILQASDLVRGAVRILGENAMDIRVDAFFQDNSDLASLVDRLKNIEGVCRVAWIENIQTIGSNDSPYGRLINQS